MKKPLNKSRRETAYKFYIEIKDDLYNSVAEFIYEKVTSNSKLKTDVDTAVYKIFDMYETSLKQARILVE